ncbi:hypothetical protein [Achromobacter xylosoxidans]|uniref:hypothetical protein n=1 Tax=Alcaligenes xylosoxydans xylosoxydans TaxID=85698 RepID=UPI00131DD9F8|nr:hypothetical protein [Achromobacter xylosoxidans]
MAFDQQQEKICRIIKCKRLANMTPAAAQAADAFMNAAMAQYRMARSRAATMLLAGLAPAI